jgi:hypothetical protein
VTDGISSTAAYFAERFRKSSEPAALLGRVAPYRVRAAGPEKSDRSPDRSAI